jgi:hypothetical protein
MRSPRGLTRAERWSANGESASSRSDWRSWRKEPAQVVPGLFTPELIVEIKALACELPVTLGLPLSRLSVADVARHAEHSGLVARISNSTVWRWLHEDTIRPWQHRCWIFPRDPHFQAKAARILDLYARCWQGQPLREDEFLISTDEKTSIQARVRIHPSLPTRPGKPMRVEHEYARGGAWTSLAALDVHRAKVFGHCEATTDIAPFERLIEQVMRQPPYNEARRVFPRPRNPPFEAGDLNNTCVNFRSGLLRQPFDEGRNPEK